jgi:hypothetical protein
MKILRNENFHSKICHLRLNKLSSVKSDFSPFTSDNLTQLAKVVLLFQ